jgi:L,D-transpeptidase catalytic domain
VSAKVSGSEQRLRLLEFEVPSMKSNRALNRCIALLAVAGLALLAPTGHVDPADAKSPRDARRDEIRPVGAPLLAVVSLNDQRVTIYNADGRMLQAPVSTGATGLETPAGIFSVVQKHEVHRSNVYEDGNMPFMQRITWTGIALHAGVLPGQPASHGCVRMPHEFAQRLFGLTDIGLRVIIVRDDIVPVPIEHPNLFKPSRQELAMVIPPPSRTTGSDRAPAIRVPASAPEAPLVPGSDRHVQILKSVAAAKAAEADAASRKATEAKQTAARKAAEAAPATKNLRGAEANLAKAEEQLKSAEGALEAANSKPSPAADSPDSAKLENARQEGIKQAEQAKERAVARLAEVRTQLETAKTQAQAKADAAARAGEEAKAAEAARDTAVEASEEASRKTSPVSVFISRKTQRLYIRKGYLPVYEGPVTIRDADKPIGSFVYTALGYTENGSDVRWNVVSMYKYGNGAEPATQPARKRGEGRGSEGMPADVTAAKAALDRIVIPQDALERISQVVLPGSSLIVSDEGASIETGKDTDFVVLMSGEPQGGLKTRRREPRPNDFFGGGKGGGFGWFWD